MSIQKAMESSGSVSILNASSRYLHASNMNVPSRSVINCSPNNSRILENDATKKKKNEEINVLSEVDNESFCSASVIFPYYEQIVAYMAGFVSTKLKKKKKWCEICCSVLLHQNINESYKLITGKDKDHLSFPSNDV